MSKINRLNIISYATFQATIVAGLGLVLGVVYAFGGLILDILVTLDWVPPTETPGLSLGSRPFANRFQYSNLQKPH